MCGIAGLVRFDRALTPEDVAAVRSMADSQIHRGPDGAGMFQDGQAVLGHRRLAIIDLSAAGHQPMSNEDGSVWISYNGEIYNFGDLRAELVGRHCFRSSTDTEVLLHGYEQWGIEGLLERLRGMFAFALWEPGNRRLTLARDRLGIKPLYYHHGNGSVAFASEVRALLRSGIVPDAADPEALPQFLLFGSVPSPLTTAKAVRNLPPGHYAVATDGGVDLRKYWDLGCPDARRPAPNAGKRALEELKARLERAVREHLISDVPLGVFLSGGVDSAAIVALASRARKDQRLTTLTLAFGEKGFDESQDALRIAHRFNTHHHELLVTGEDFAQEMPLFLAGMDQPTNDGVNTWFVSKAARQCGLTVVLSGLGGDEVFWGYGHYRRTADGAPARRVLECLPGFARRGLIAGASAYGDLRGQGKWKRLSALKNGVTAEAMYYSFRGFFSPPQAGRLLGLSGAERNRMMERAVSELRPAGSNGFFDPANMNRIEMKRYLQDQLLRDTDVFSMAHSIEVRVPFLDHELVECAAALPARVKLDAAVNKPALVRAVQDAAVTEAGSRPKMGFTFPMDQWMKRQSGALGEVARSARGLERDEVAKAWRAFERGRLHWSQAWGLVVLGAQKQAVRRA